MKKKVTYLGLVRSISRHHKIGCQFTWVIMMVTGEMGRSQLRFERRGRHWQVETQRC
jgi:hypothetical protein